MKGRVRTEEAIAATGGGAAGSETEEPAPPPPAIDVMSAPRRRGRRSWTVPGAVGPDPSGAPSFGPAGGRFRRGGPFRRGPGRPADPERDQLCRELHDVLGPVLTAASMRAETARSCVSDDGTADDAMAVLGMLMDDLRHAVEEVRRLARCEGSAPIGTVAGVCDVLEQQARRFEDASCGRLRVEVAGPDVEDAVSPELGHALCRMAAEGLTNVVRHAAARTCWLSLTDRPDGLRLEICDDGVGMAPTAAPGTGLTSMARRAEWLGGSLHVGARSPHGTRIVASLPRTA